jgi:hypothetical protein
MVLFAFISLDSPGSVPLPYAPESCCGVVTVWEYADLLSLRGRGSGPLQAGATVFHTR